MIALVLGSLLMAAGVPFLARGWIFTLRPEHPISTRARERNMRLGLETDMRLWGRRVRRMGFLIFVSGSALAAWGAGLFG